MYRGESLRVQGSRVGSEMGNLAAAKGHFGLIPHIGMLVVEGFGVVGSGGPAHGTASGSKCRLSGSYAPSPQTLHAQPEARAMLGPSDSIRSRTSRR